MHTLSMHTLSMHTLSMHTLSVHTLSVHTLSVQLWVERRRRRVPGRRSLASRDSLHPGPAVTAPDAPAPSQHVAGR